MLQVNRAIKKPSRLSVQRLWHEGTKGEFKKKEKWKQKPDQQLLRNRSSVTQRLKCHWIICFVRYNCLNKLYQIFISRSEMYAWKVSPNTTQKYLLGNVQSRTLEKLTRFIRHLHDTPSFFCPFWSWRADPPRITSKQLGRELESCKH